MHPVIFEIGGFSIHTYGVLVALGILVGIIVFRRGCAEQGLDLDEMTDFAIYFTVAGLLGARLFYVLSDIEYYLDHPMEILFSRSGFVFYGGFLVGGLTAILIVRKRRYPVWKVGDALAPAAALGHAIGRLGCFSQGCCYGKFTDSIFGMTFPASSSVAAATWVNPITQRTPAVYPTQLIESAGLLLTFLFLVLVIKRRPERREGDLLLWYGFLYGLLRYWVEFLRGDFRGEYFLHLSISQWIGMMIAFLCAGIVLFRSRTNAVQS